MNWQMAMRRQAVVAWRDEQIMTAYSLFSAKVQEARASFEQALVEHARLYDTVWDPTGFAEPRIDAQLRKILPKALADFVDDAATGLADIAPEFGELAKALRHSHTLSLPHAKQVELAAAPATAVLVPRPPLVSDQAALPDASDERWTITKHMERLAGSAGQVVKRGAEIVQKQADVLADTLQDKAGLRERVRIAAQKRIASHWMSEAGDPLPVLAQLIRIIDTTTETARMSML
ncbi:hypothetical protein SAMN05518849_112140 [Sphingobium sp. AP50]|uniref:hypothetical protein n=1 Tax=Sphingobium sp. AP50 TaxID=1884369 RepID=UPI0008BD3372|nr:hypothetical protein [Sphingobium sp. AP50]SEJ74468.1 hypothetical protein SAMN05518849_112140 [Sphingobium sp. AP50]